MNTRQVQEHLRALGWPISVDGSYGPQTRSAVMEFQNGNGLPDQPMLVDGMAGPSTHHWLSECVRRGGQCSVYFKFAEFKSKGNSWIKVERELVRRLDILRHHYGPINVISGYRDPAHNRKVGGASNSQHLYGGACDTGFARGAPSIAAVKRLGLFCGIGFVASTGKVAHVDVRGLGGTPNTTGGSPQNPTTWKYGR